MTETRHCSACGSILTGDAPDGICPRCLFRVALESNTAGAVGRSEPWYGISFADADATPASRADPLRFPSRFGDYDLLEFVGRGGMGIVYRARQRSLDRIVAVKLLTCGPQADAEHQERFHAEATAAAALQHPNIVAIHATGVHAGWPYLAMDFVDGSDLAKLVAESSRMPAARSARYVRDVARAVHFAHEHGVLHRDLKPSNVLVDAQDRPRLTDFGLARRIADHTQLTLSRQLVGSPGYLPPEQADSQWGKVSRRSDIYGLGAILYHLLTGRAPFVGETHATMVYHLLHTEVTRPRILAPDVPRDLETICLRCLEKEPLRRYATAEEVAQELDRFLEGQPILAHPERGPVRWWRWCRRRPLVVGLAILAGIAGWLGADMLRASRGLRHEQRDRAIDTALTAAWGGDTEGARAAIQSAAAHGARPEWVEMLEAQVDMHALHTDDAIAHAERAVQLAPDETAPRAMLAAAALWCGDSGRYGQALGQLEGFVPSSAIDHFFLGTALVAAHPDTERPVVLLERAVQMRPSGICFLALALAEGFRAADIGSWELVQRATDHLNSAELILGHEHPAVGVVRMNTANMILRLCPSSEYLAARRKGEDSAAALAATTAPIGHMQRAFFFQLTGDEAASLIEWEQAARRSRTSMFIGWYAAAMFGEERSGEALVTLEQLALPKDPVIVVAQAHLLRDLGRPEDANLIYAQAAIHPEGIMSTMLQTIPLLGGDRERAARDSALWLRSSSVPSHQRPILACIAGSQDWETLLDAAAGSRLAQCATQHYIALSHLADGDRNAAMLHFRASVAAGTHWIHLYQWSRAFLRRMERDPAWPAWIHPAPQPVRSD